MQESKPVGSSPASSSIFNISIAEFKQIQALGLSLDHIFILECFRREVPSNEFITSVKTAEIIISLKRKGFITNDGMCHLTEKALVMFSSLEKGTPISVAVIKRKEAGESPFDKWWDAYPRTDVFEYKGKKFNGTRSLRVKKDDCKIKFQKILSEGEYTAEDLIRSLLYEVHLKMEASVREGENKMKYMQGSLTYLTQRTFENFIEISKVNPIKEQKGGDDI